MEEEVCCECGSEEHTCQDCPVFMDEEFVLDEEFKPYFDFD